MLSNPPRGTPHFFIVGAPKCGTTSISQYLNQHPDLFVLRGEPHFFGRDIDYNAPRLSPRQYRTICQAAGHGRLVGDRSTWYLYSRKAASEIYEFNPNARIIAMVRNPADMLYSLHAHQYQRGRRDDVASLSDALAREADRRIGREVPTNVRFVESLFYSEIPRYTEQIRRYHRCFGADQVRVVLFDDLVRHPSQVYRDLLDFIGVDPSFEADFSVHNAAAPTPDTWLFRRWKASTLRYRARSLVPEPVYRSIRARRRRQLMRSARRAPRPPLPMALRARMNEMFAGEIQQLGALIGRDLDHWLEIESGPGAAVSGSPATRSSMQAD